VVDDDALLSVGLIRSKDAQLPVGAVPVPSGDESVATTFAAAVVCGLKVTKDRRELLRLFLATVVIVLAANPLETLIGKRSYADDTPSDRSGSSSSVDIR